MKGGRRGRSRSRRRSRRGRSYSRGSTYYNTGYGYGYGTGYNSATPLIAAAAIAATTSSTRPRTSTSSTTTSKKKKEDSGDDTGGTVVCIICCIICLVPIFYYMFLGPSCDEFNEDQCRADDYNCSWLGPDTLFETKEWSQNQYPKENWLEYPNYPDRNYDGYYHPPVWDNNQKKWVGEWTLDKDTSNYTNKSININGDVVTHKEQIIQEGECVFKNSWCSIQ